MRASGQSMVQIARVLGVHRAALYRHLNGEVGGERLEGLS
jgi:DNA-binding phage protein